LAPPFENTSILPELAIFLPKDRTGMNLLTVFIVLLVGAYIFILASQAKRTEAFADKQAWIPEVKPKDFNAPETKVIMDQRVEAPYIQNPIYSVDDYEYNLIFQNEGDKEMTRKEINRLTAQYPLDWSVQPPNSAVFQKGVAELRQRAEKAIKSDPTEGFQDTAEPSSKPMTLNPYKEIEGQALTPPDTTAVEMEERKILQTYKPAKADSLTTYDLEDAKTLISKIYDAKGLIPTIVRKPDNVYEVIGTRRKDEKIVYEDEEAPAAKEPVQKAGEATITVPPTALDVAVGLDPFFTPEPSMRTNRWDYTKWTPGLERTFAPTFATENWY
jgi:hypothetical protein